MTWYDWPALAFILAFAISLSPRRRVSHYFVAFGTALACGLAVMLLTLGVWGVTR